MKGVTIFSLSDHGRASFVYVRGSEFFQAPGSPCLRHCSFLPEFFTSIPLDAGWTEGKTSLFFLIAGAVWFLVKYLPGRQEWELQGIMLYVTLFLHGAGVYWLLTVSGARIKGSVG